MGDDIYCLLGAAFTLVAIAYMSFLVFGPGRPPPVFRNLDDVREAWRQSTTFIDKLFFLALFYRYLKGPAFVAALVVMTGPIVAIGLSLCGMDVQELRIVHAIVQDVLNYLRELQKQPPVGAVTYGA